VRLNRIQRPFFNVEHFFMPHIISQISIGLLYIQMQMYYTNEIYSVEFTEHFNYTLVTLFRVYKIGFFKSLMQI